MKNLIICIKKNTGYIGVEAVIISALMVAFSLAIYNYISPTCVDIAVSAKDAITGTY